MPSLVSPNVHRAAMLARARASLDAPIPLAPPVAEVYRRLLERPELRGETLEHVADVLRRPIEVVQAAAMRLAEDARRAAGAAPRSGVSSAPSSTIDRVLAEAGGAAAPPASSPAPLYVMHPRRLATVLRYMPQARRAPIVRRMIELAGLGYMPDAGAMLTDLAGKYASDPGYQWRWTVVVGDNPSRIAKQVTGDDRRYVELIAANPSKATVGSASSPFSTGYNFKSLVAGEKLDIPKAWNVYIASDGSGYTGGVVLPKAPAPVTIVKVDTTDVTYASSLPAGAITAIKVQLGAWGTREKTMTGYPTVLDLDDAQDEAFLGAVRKFQVWSNARGSSLRTDGRLDAATHKAIEAYTTAITTAPPVTPPPVTPPPGLPPLKPPAPPAPPPDGAPPVVAKKKVGGSAVPIILLAGIAAVASGAV